jgi:hypothetical protein
MPSDEHLIKQSFGYLVGCLVVGDGVVVVVVLVAFVGSRKSAIMILI